MKTSAVLILTLALLGLAPGTLTAQKKPPACVLRELAQENYLALSQQLYLYVPNIDKAAGGWKPFTVRVLFGQYRPPLLLQKGLMNEAALNRLLSGRQDILQYPLAVPGYAPKAAARPAFGAPLSVPGTPITVRVVRVDPAAGVSVFSDKVTFEVCGLRG